MTDERLRDLERRWNRTGSLDDAIAFATECERAGQPLDGKRALNRFVRDNRTNTSAIAQVVKFDPLCYTGAIAFDGRMLQIFESAQNEREIDFSRFARITYGGDIRVTNLACAGGELKIILTTPNHDLSYNIGRYANHIIDPEPNEYPLADARNGEITYRSVCTPEGNIQDILGKITDATYYFRPHGSLDERLWRSYRDACGAFDSSVAYIENLTVFTRTYDTWELRTYEEDGICRIGNKEQALLPNLNSFHLGLHHLLPLHCRYAQGRNFVLHEKELFSVIDMSLGDHPRTTIQEAPLNILEQLRLIADDQAQPLKQTRKFKR